MEDRYDAVVLGAGIVGLFASLTLAKNGMKTLLVEKFEHGKGASYHSAGVMTVQLDNRRDIDLVRRSLELVGKLEDEGKASLGIAKTGYLTVGPKRVIKEDYEFFKQAGLKVTMYEEEVKKIWPHIKVYEGEACIYTEEDLSVEPKDLMSKGLTTVARLGVKTLVKREAMTLLVEDRVAKGVLLSDGSRVYADSFLLCLGPWNKHFLSRIGVNLGTIIMRCPVIKLRVPHGHSYPGIADEAHHSYWRPSGATSLVGGGYEADIVEGPDEAFKPPNQGFVRRAVKLLSLRLECARYCSVEEAWCGPCSILPSGEPLLASVDGMENVIVVDGLRGYGLMRGPAIGEMAADVALGKKTLHETYKLGFVRSLAHPSANP